MSQFALVGMQEIALRYIKEHSFLKLLPIKWAEAIIPKTKPRLTHIIYAQDNQKELGYIMDVPGFFIDQSKMEDSGRVKLIHNVIDLLVKNDIRTLAFPLWREFISVDEKTYLEENSITLLDGHLIRLILLMMTIEKIFGIPKVKPHTMDVGIWGADTSIGQVWAESLAPFINYMTLGGKNTIILEDLSDRILYNTGLSCNITTDPKQCLSNKTLAILEGLPEEENLLNSKITVFWGHLWSENKGIGNKKLGTIFMESGWASIPNTLRTLNTLTPWDQIGILEANIFILDETYKNILIDDNITLEEIWKIKKILKSYDIVQSSGMISNNELLSYNDFRRLYFANNLDKSTSGNYN